MDYQIDWVGSMDGTSSDTYQLSPAQIAELMEQARGLVESYNLERLSWDDAWNGIYPDEPSVEDISAEFELLQAKTTRILSGNADLHEEYATWSEHRRMIALEDCKTFNIWLAL